MARKKRVDSKGRVLKVGESQRKDGLYMYRFTDDTGERQTIYANNVIELRERTGNTKGGKRKQENELNMQVICTCDIHFVQDYVKMI